MAADASRRHLLRPSGRGRPIILLELADPASDDRFVGWARFFALEPLPDDAEIHEAGVVPAEG